MRAFAIPAVVALALGACQSLTIVDKTPGRKAVAEILVAALQCRETTDEATGETVKCDPAMQPKEVSLASLDCEALPLRSAVAERAHARCEWTGDMIRTNGERAALPKTAGEFSLVNLTPGAYRPTDEWRLGGKLE